jgi:hypothetical protein
LVENNRSKAVLLLAIDEICRHFPNTFYYPSYEILMDDLRDYRFYEADLIHPNGQAIDYIWQHFSDTFFNDETKAIIREVEKINAMEAHRPLHGTQTEGYQQFAQQLHEKIAQLTMKYPFLNFKTP